MYMSATYILLKLLFIPRGRNLDYRCVYDVNNVICVKTGLDWRNLRFKMERIRKKGKQHDSSDVTFRIVPTTDENWQARSDLSESVCS